MNSFTKRIGARAAAVLTLALCAIAGSSTTASAQAKPKYRSVTLGEVRGVANAAKVAQTGSAADSYSLHVPTSLTIHPAFEGAVGPFDVAYVYLRPAGENDAQLWVVAKHNGEWRAWAPAVLEGFYQAKAIFFDDVNHDGQPEVFLLHSKIAGAGGARDFNDVLALQWDPKAQKFAARPEWFEGVEQDMSTARDARNHLANAGATKSSIPTTQKTQPQLKRARAKRSRHEK